MMGPFTQSYQPLGDLTIVFEHGDVGREYRRELDLTTAIASVRYEVGDATFTRDVFASQPAQVVAIRLAVDRPGRLTFVARLSSLLRSSTDMVDQDIRLRGRAPAHVDPSYHDQDIPVVYDDQGGMRFEARLRAIARDGRTRVDSDGLHVDGASDVLLLLAAATSFNGFDRSPVREGRDEASVVEQQLSSRGNLLGEPASGARGRPSVADAPRHASTSAQRPRRPTCRRTNGSPRWAPPTRSSSGCCSTTAATC